MTILLLRALLMLRAFILVGLFQAQNSLSVLKKTIFSLMAFAAVSNAFAGGLLTNTNQNAAFVRNFAQEGKIDLTSIYANPAGGAFLRAGSCGFPRSES